MSGPASATNLFSRSMAALASAALSGCVVFPASTTATPEERARPARAERLLSLQERRDDSTATLVVTRDEGAFGIACYYALAIDGRLAARLDAGERAYFHLVPGEALVQVGADPLATGLCSVGQGKGSERQLMLGPDEIAYFRLALEKTGHVLLKRSGP